MNDVYVDTVSAINFNNGVVKMLLVDQNPETITQQNTGEATAEIEPRIKQQVVMPLPGFLYMLSVIKGLMEDPKMVAVIEKYAELGLLPTDPTQTGEDTSAS